MTPAEVEKWLDTAARRSVNLTPVWLETVDPALSKVFRDQFATAGAAGGHPWAPLSPATQRARVRAGGNRGGVNRPLWDSGRLRGSLVKVGPESIHVVQPQHFERGTQVPYAHLHQEGFTVKRWGRTVFGTPKRVPARVIIPDPMPDALVNAWAKAVGDYVVQEGGR